MEDAEAEHKAQGLDQDEMNRILGEVTRGKPAPENESKAAAAFRAAIQDDVKEAIEKGYEIHIPGE